MRSAVRSALAAWHRMRFAAWVAWLRLQLARFGARLEVDAPHGAHLEAFPRVRIFPEGEGDSRFRLRLGRDVRLGRNVVIEVFAGGTNALELGERGRVLNAVRIALRGGSVAFGPECLIRDGVWIKSGGDLRAGAGVTLSSYTAVHCTDRIELADLVGIGERVSVIDSDHTFDGTDAHYMRKPLIVSPVSIGRNSMVAFGSVVLRGAEIGRNCVVAANAVVRAGTYGDGVVLAGNPAEAVKRLAPPE